MSDSVALPDPTPRRPGEHGVATGEPIRFVLNWAGRYSLWVVDIGLACCAVEFVAAAVSSRAVDPPPTADPGQTELLVVSGTVTDKMAPMVRRLYDRLPEPKYVLSFGACANSGGPYWDSYSVTKGVDQLLPVDVYVPGCPPRPEALLRGIRQLQQAITRDRAGFGTTAPTHPGTRRAGGTDAASLTAAPVHRR